MTTQPPEVDDAVLRTLVPLGALPSNARQEILTQAQVERISAGRFVFREGDNDNDAVYLLDGEVQFLANGRLVNAARGGTDETRHPLHPSRPRTHSARASDTVTVLRVDRSLLDKQLTWFQSADGTTDGAGAGEDWTGRLSRSSLFAHIPAPNIRKIFHYMESVSARKGDVIIEQGAEGDFYYVIEKGRCAVTRRPSASDPEIRLAELKEGDGFGEQALLSDARHSATVYMVSDGKLRRLAKDAFLKLIKSPAIRSVDGATAKAMARKGAVWLDVRLPEEHRESGIENSLNIPLARLGQELKKLSSDRKYLVYCDSGERSSAATSLLFQAGLEAYVLKGGLVSLKGATVDREAVTEDKSTSGQSVTSLDADITLSRLQVALAHAKQHVEVAAQRRVEREAAIRASAKEAKRLRREKHATDDKLAAEIARRLENEQKRYEGELVRADEALKDAHRAQMEVEAAKRMAEEKAAHQRAAAKKARDALKKKLSEGKRQLEAEYTRASEALEELERQRAKDQSKLERERDTLEARVRRTGARVEELDQERRKALRAHEDTKESLSRLEERAQRQLRELKERENGLRAKAEAELREGRTRLQATFARNLQLLEQARREEEYAEAAKRAAEEESKRIAEKAKQKREQIRREAEKRLQAERKRLEREAAEINAQLNEARRIKEQAELAQREAMLRAEKLLQVGTNQRPEADRKNAISAEIKRRQQELEHARGEELAARRARMDLEVSKKIVEKTQAARGSLKHKVAADFRRWMKEEPEQEDDPLERTSRIQDALKHMNARMEAERRAEVEANEEMFDEITSQLHNRNR